MDVKDQDRFDTMEAAALQASILEQMTGDHHFAYRTSYVFNPFKVFKAPKVGDVVSMGFNGDYYPVGKITRISKTYRKIVTKSEDGHSRIFWRVGKSATWKFARTFTLIEGVHDERNPSF